MKEIIVVRDYGTLNSPGTAFIIDLGDFEMPQELRDAYKKKYAELCLQTPYKIMDPDEIVQRLLDEREVLYIRKRVNPQPKNPQQIAKDFSADL